MTDPVLTVLGFDYGQRRIGVAVGQTLTCNANPLATIKNGPEGVDWDAISILMSQWQPDRIVLGLPSHADGSKSTMTKAVNNFGNQLQARYNLPVEKIDERLSSHEAEQLMFENNISQKKRKADLDQYAAKVILDSWFQEYNATLQR